MFVFLLGVLLTGSGFYALIHGLAGVFFCVGLITFGVALISLPGAGR
jgi:hypothetical protein